MTTATPPRPQPPAPLRHGPGSPGPAGGVAPIDPIKLAKQYAPLLMIAGFIGAVLGLGAHMVLIRVAPVWTSSVIYACSPELPDITKREQTNYNQDEFERFMQTQVQIMLSDAIIQAAVRDPLVHQTDWAKPFLIRGVIDVPAASRDLEKHLSARALANSQLIRLSMSWRNKGDVATIVNAINRAYLEDLRRNDDLISSDRRQALARRLADTRTEIARLEGQRQQIIEGGLDAIETQFTGASMEMMELTTTMVTIEASIASLRGLLDARLAMIDGGRVVHFPDNIREQANQDPVIRNIDMEITSLRAELRAMALEGQGQNHPTVRRIRSLLEGKEQERQTKYEQVLRQLFDAEIDMFRQRLTSSQAQLAGAQEKFEATKKKREELLVLKVRMEQVLSDIETQTKNANNLEEAVRGLDSQRDLKVANRVRVLRQGQTPNTVSFPKMLVMVPAGAVLLPVLIGGIVLLRELFDQRVRGPADIALIPRLRVLGVVPNASEDPTRPANVATAFRDSPGGAVTESFRQLRAPLAKRMDQMGHKSLLVLSGMPGSGGSSVVSNLALIAAASEQRVLVIDANLRRPIIHKTFGLQDGPGLGDVLAGAATLESAAQPSSTPNLSVLTAGSAATRNMPERLSTETMANLIREASAAYDLVLIDAPPAIVSGDGFTLANRCDAVILVVRAMAEKRGLVARLQNQLGDTRAELLGVVLNAVRASAGGYFKRNIKATHEYQKAAKA